MPMDIDPLEIAKVKDEAERPARHRWLNPAVGVAVALLATFMGICKVKDDNIVQAMQQAQADKLRAAGQGTGHEEGRAAQPGRQGPGDLRRAQLP
jgi:hypothetical protein